jgi:rhomboid domain-containing protein 1
MSRVTDSFSAIPTTTKFLLGFNIAIHVLIFVTSASLNSFAIGGHLVIDDGEYYRIVSSAFVHAGIMHIGMNMMSLFQMGPSIETQFGSLMFLLITIWSVFIAGTVYVSMAYLLAIVTGDIHSMYSNGVGFSGILFTYAIIESYHSTVESRSIFGMFSVPAKFYPFILLILLQVS